MAGSCFGQTLTHRYSFFNAANGATTAIDSIGSANGTLYGNAAISNGLLRLNGTSGTYLGLPSGLISSAYQSATIEAWVNFGALPVNCFFFGFGNTDSSGSGEDYVFCAPEAGRVAITATDPGYTGEQNATSGANWSGQTNFHFVAIFNPPGKYIAVYTNGILAALNTNVTDPISSVKRITLSYVGRSLYTSDPYPPFSLQEFRIYNGAMTPQQVALDDASGATQIVSSPGALASISLPLTNQMKAGRRADRRFSSAIFANVSNVNLMTYGQPTLVSSNVGVLTISSSGVITAIAPGTATVAASYRRFDSYSNRGGPTGFATNLYTFGSFGDGFWTIQNVGNGNVFAPTSSAGPEQTYTNGAAAQQFEILYNLQNGTFRLRQESSWNCVGVNSAVSGAPVETVAFYSGVATHQWYLIPAGGGAYRIFNATGSLVMQSDTNSPGTVTLAHAINQFAPALASELSDALSQEGIGRLRRQLLAVGYAMGV